MSDFQKIFTRLKVILKEFEDKLEVIVNNDNEYSLNGNYSEKYKKNLWFGAVQIKKNYVSFHLMPVYMYSDLAKKIPEKLKKRMQGKSCFNFSKYDEELFDELGQFTKICYAAFQKRGDDIKSNC